MGSEGIIVLIECGCTRCVGRRVIWEKFFSVKTAEGRTDRGMQMQCMRQGRKYDYGLCTMDCS